MSTKSEPPLPNIICMDLIDETDEINGPFTAIFPIPYAPSNDPFLQRPSAAIV